MLSSIKNLFIITNNHFQGQALVNALQIRSRLTNQSPEIPSPLLEAYPVLKEIADSPPFKLDQE